MMMVPAYRAVDNVKGRAVWAGIPRHPRCLGDLEPRSAAHLLQRWLTRRGVREVVSAIDGGIPVVSLGQTCTIRCLPGKLVWRDKDTDHLFACQELPDDVESACQRAAGLPAHLQLVRVPRAAGVGGRAGRSLRPAARAALSGTAR